MIRKIPTRRAAIVRMIETPAFVWALYIAGVLAVIVANLEKFA
jgi:hypothetical protein